MDQLHMHFTSAVHNSAYKVVHAHTEHDLSKKQYAHLCKVSGLTIFHQLKKILIQFICIIYIYCISPFLYHLGPTWRVVYSLLIIKGNIEWKGYKHHNVCLFLSCLIDQIKLHVSSKILRFMFFLECQSTVNSWLTRLQLNWDKKSSHLLSDIDTRILIYEPSPFPCMYIL